MQRGVRGGYLGDFELGDSFHARTEDRCFERGDSVADALVAILRSAVFGENIDFLRRWFGALDTCDGEVLIALCDPSGVFVSSLAMVDGAYHGHDRMRMYLGDLEDEWGTDMRIEPVVGWG